MEPLKILLAEDVTINQKFLCHFLTEQGHKVVPVHNGKEALSALETENFDLVLMDIQMPVMDGIEATKHIREAKARKINPDIPIIALTAYTMEEDKERFLQAGINDYIAKPLDTDKLLDLITYVAGTKNKAKLDSYHPTKKSYKNQEIINMQILLDIYPLDFISKMLQIFLDSADNNLAEIHDAVKTKDLDLVQEKLHSLAGTAAIMKATSLQKTSRNLMHYAREKDVKHLQDQLPELDREINKLTEFIRHMPLLEEQKQIVT